MIVVVAAGSVTARVVEAVGDGVPVSLAARTGGMRLTVFYGRLHALCGRGECAWW